MKQVKIFTGAAAADGFDDLEGRINQWLAENSNVEIISRDVIGLTGINVAMEEFVNCTIVIFYR